MLSKTVSGPTSGEIGVVTWRPGKLEPVYVDWAVAGARYCRRQLDRRLFKYLSNQK